MQQACSSRLVLVGVWLDTSAIAPARHHEKQPSGEVFALCSPGFLLRPIAPCLLRLVSHGCRLQ
ncbi:hypothetical protein [Thermoleptolyngbya sp. C42_A2020_037]|uniref:hypothetical protein n=1 Tax=Thermoleptolyngbya sp. C42_A2020_037 TaxID=2747799 RepID=UPI0019ED213F|nr:hypothetical protein [Thermoleptolyngbya sp. C42_A2020_037]MBF2086235.1 hypothetical protein [Thermoleptolyngbya sp. C42_A2020_037]